MRFRPSLLALAVSLSTVSAVAGAQTAAPAAKPATATQPVMPARPGAAVARPATPAKAATATAATPATPAKPATVAAAKSEPIDINTASKTELQTIPGIGDVYATKIIAGRPYHSKDELTRKKILPTAVYAKTKDRLVARQH